jgi:hypothetical protein
MATKVTQTTEGSVSEVGNGIKLLGEVVVPGASQFIDGNIRNGGLHLLGAVAAMTLLGGPGGLLVSALVRGNSYTSSTLDKTLYRSLVGERDKTEPAPAGGKLATT